jgi:hypothetical protein
LKTLDQRERNKSNPFSPPKDVTVCNKKKKEKKAKSARMARGEADRSKETIENSFLI